MEQPEPAAGGPQFDTPPPVTVRAGDKTFDLTAWAYCYDTGCADGAPPQNPPDLGQAPQVEIEFPLDGWTFEAVFVPAGDPCPRRQSVPVEQTGAGTYVVTPAGVADTYDVTLFGRGDGDLFVTFRWTTPSDGPMPIPHARLAVLADHDGRVDSYGVELELSDLARTPEGATAEVTVSSADGESLTFDAIPAPQCFAEGTVFWDGPDQAGLDAAALGPAPFTYEVVVTLDGVEHVAIATWPADQIAGNEPSVALVVLPTAAGTAVKWPVRSLSLHSEVAAAGCAPCASVAASGSTFGSVRSRRARRHAHRSSPSQNSLVPVGQRPGPRGQTRPLAPPRSIGVFSTAGASSA